MTVVFNQIPSDIRVPGVYVEVNAGRGPFSYTNRLLLIGQKLSGGIATAGVVERMDESQIYRRYGDGSMLADMAFHARAQAPIQEIWCLPLADPGSGTQATGTITAKTASFPLGKPALLVLYIAGIRTVINVLATDDEVAVGANIAAAINAGFWRGRRRVKYPVSAAVGGTGSEHIVTLTARHKGATGNDIDVSVCLAEDDDKTARDALTIVAMANGAGTLDLASALAVLGDEPFDTIVAPYSDTTAVADVTAFLEARWRYDNKIYGHYFTWKFDTYGNLGTYGAARNSQYVTVFGSKKLSHPTWAAVAAAGGDIAVNLGGANRNRPLVGVVLNGIMAKAKADEFTIAERDSLLRDGISPIEIRGDRQVMLERVITTYQTSDEGVEDVTWLDVQTRYMVTYAVRYVNDMLRARYSRRTLDEDDDATVQDMRGDLINAYKQLIIRGVADNEAGFRQRLVVQRNLDDPTRIDVYFPLDVQNLLMVTAVNATAYLRFSYA